MGDQTGRGEGGRAGSQEERGDPCGRVYGRARRVHAQAGTRASTPLLALASKRLGVQVVVLAAGLFGHLGAAACRAVRVVSAAGADIAGCGGRGRCYHALLTHMASSGHAGTWTACFV